MIMDSHQPTGGALGEIFRMERFGFGRNWERLVSSLDERQVTKAEQSLRLDAWRR